MSKTPNFDKKVKEILDDLKPGERACVLTGDKWMMDEEEIDWYKKFNVPPLSTTPLNHLKIVMGFAATYQWWWNKHANTGEPVMTYVHPATDIKIVPDDEWFNNDYSEIQLEFDATRPLFEMLRELQLKVPLNHSRNMQIPENSISRASFGDVNSYFVSGCRSKNTWFANDSMDVESSMEIQTANKISDSFNVLHSQRIHGSKFVRESYDCVNCSFVFDCRNCEYCFGAWNKRNQKFLFFNEQLSESEWHKRVNAIDLGSRKTLDEYKERFYNEIIQDKAVWPENFNVNSTDCTGEYLMKSDKCHYCWMSEEGRDCFWCMGIFENSQNCAFSAGLSGENVYGTFSGFSSANCKFCFFVTRCDDCEYCMACFECTHCFGCVGLRNKKFHIFNKEYSEDEYWKKVDELKSAMLDRGEYGKFLPLSMSPSYFPEAGAVVYYGAEPEEGKMLGALDFDPASNDAYGESLVDPATVIDPEKVPDHINDIDPDEWCNKPINDPVQGRRFSYYKPEIAMYKKMGIAASNAHFIRRVYELYYQINTGKEMEVPCGKCGISITAGFNKAFQKRNIYCTKCYLEYLEKNG